MTQLGAAVLARAAATIALVLIGSSCVSERGQPTPSAPQSTGPTATTDARPSSSTPLPTIAAPRETPTPDEERLVRTLVEFARAPSAGTLGAVLFADKVRLGLSNRLMVERTSLDLVRLDAWVLRQEQPFRGRVIGPYSALDLLAKSGPTTISVGPHPHCASPPVPPPADLVGARRISVQPTGIDTCLFWWTVDLFVSPSGRIEAVTVDFWEP